MQQDESGRIGEMERKGPEEKCNLLFVAGMNSAAGHRAVINANVCSSVRARPPGH